MLHLLKPSLINIAALAPITVIGPVVLPQSSRMFDLLMSISRPNIPIFVHLMRPKTVDTCVGLEPLTKDVRKGSVSHLLLLVGQRPDRSNQES